MQANGRQMAELQRRHAADRKQLSKQQKKEWRNHRQTFSEQTDTRRAGIVSEQERSRLRQVCYQYITCVSPDYYLCDTCLSLSPVYHLCVTCILSTC